MSALYMSMSAGESELEIEDELAKGGLPVNQTMHDKTLPLLILMRFDSPESLAGSQVQDLLPIKEELRAREGRPLSRFENCPIDSKPHGPGGSKKRSAQHACGRTITDNPLQQNEVASHLEDPTEIQEGVFPNDDRTQKYGNLLFLLQSEPRHIAHLSRLVSMAEIDSLLQTVMFTIYGNQYESREEHLLLTMFQVRLAPECILLLTSAHR